MVTPPSTEEVEAMLDTEGKASLEKLKGLSGADFDKAYLTAQLDGHTKLLMIQEDYLKAGQDRGFIAPSALPVPSIEFRISAIVSCAATSHLANALTMASEAFFSAARLVKDNEPTIFVYVACFFSASPGAAAAV